MLKISEPSLSCAGVNLRVRVRLSLDVYYIDFDYFCKDSNKRKSIFEMAQIAIEQRKTKLSKPKPNDP